MSEKKLSPYKSKAVNIKFAENLISMGDKIIYGILGVPIAYLLQPEKGLDWVTPYILFAAAFTIGTICMQRKGFKILEENTPD